MKFFTSVLIMYEILSYVTFYLVMAALQVCFSQSTSPKNIFQLSSFSIIPHARVFRKY